MAFCVGCGNRLNEAAAFCGKCGEAVAATPAAPAQARGPTFFRVLFAPARMLLRIGRDVVTAKSPWIRLGVPTALVLIAIAAALAPPDKDSSSKPLEAGSASGATSEPADAPPPDLAALPDSTVTAEQKATALRALCGAMVGAASAAKPDEDRKTIDQIAVLSADQAIAKNYNLEILQANAILQVALNEQIERGPGRMALDIACNPR